MGKPLLITYSDAPAWKRLLYAFINRWKFPTICFAVKIPLLARPRPSLAIDYYRDRSVIKNVTPASVLLVHCNLIRFF